MIELLLAVLVGMTVHEAAHAAAAGLLGDEAAWRRRGSLHPLRHLGSAGWAPVLIRRRLLTRRDYVLVLLAGPAANLVLAGMFAALDLPVAAAINLFLASLNLLPLPGLDGGRILEELTSTKGTR
jgi:Zn-dependent protease